MLKSVGRASAFVLFATASGVYAATPSIHEVHLFRDSFGMAHLYADREEDGFYGLGYAIAEDRLQQVLTLYVAVRGELAATFGPKLPALPSDSPEAQGNESSLSDTVASDLDVRRFRLLQTARQNFSRLPLQYQRDLRAYIAGLAAYMAQHPRYTPAWAPPLEPALPMAVLDLLVQEAKNVCDRRRADSQLPNAFVVPPIRVSGPTAFSASNAWAIAGSRTADGRVLFESDSHSPIEEYGTLFYPYRIKAGDLDVMAFEPAGSAMPFFGHSPYFAWGITEAPRFVADCYGVTVEHRSARRFLFDGHIQSLEAVPYSIAVKGARSVRGVFEYSHHNGVESPVTARAGDVAYVVSYASADRIGLQGGEYYLMAKAHTRDELEAALAERDAYPANLVVGGADGTIMYIRPGRIPIRAAGVDARQVLDGNSSTTLWQGVHAYSQLLKLINPIQGYVGNSNVSPDMMFPVSPLQPADYPAYFGFDAGATNSRELRLIELLDHAKSVTLDEAMSFAMDEMIIPTRSWAGAIRHALQDHPEFIAAQQPEYRQFAEDLTQFDGNFSKESRGALDHSELRRVLFDNHKSAMASLCEAIEANWPLTRDQQQLLLTAIGETRQHMLDYYGRTDLSWGDVHRIGRGGVDLPVGGGILLLGTDPGSVGQAASTVQAESLRALEFVNDSKTKRQRLIGGQRIPFVVHFAADGVQSYAQALWGISDNPNSKHYSDQARLASEKILRPIPLTRPALQAVGATESVLTIPSESD
jgi:acyl-homoserine-lactone acylase